MTQTVPTELADRIASTNDRYNLLADRSTAAVALSGGKDSVFLALALKTLGYDVLAIAVDLGYDPEWRTRIESLCRTADLSLEVVDPREPTTSSIQSVTITRKDELQTNLKAVDALAQGEDSSVTPCTSCYNVKAVALDAALTSLGLDCVAFGHHATDAAASLLKSALMYVDRWENGHVVYSIDSFRDLAERFREEWLDRTENTEGSLTEATERLITDGKASTDEPPRQQLLETSHQIIVRPMIGIWEGEIREAVSQLPFEPEASGCGHTLLESTRTPREIVQYEVLDALEPTRSLALLLDLVERCLDENGRLKSHARRHRKELLGDTYKPSYSGIEKY